MKRLAIYVVLAFLGWDYYQKKFFPKQVEPQVESLPVYVATSTTKEAQHSFSCDGRQHCSQMNSRAEAEYFLASCPNTKMDGDHDGIPCENDSRF